MSSEALWDGYVDSIWDSSSFEAWNSIRDLTLFRELDYFHLPESLSSLKFDSDDRLTLTLPNNLRNLTFGHRFNQHIHGIMFNAGLQNLTFGDRFNNPVEHVRWPETLRTLRFGISFNQPMEWVTLPNGLQILTFSGAFNRSLEHVTLPSGLLELTFDGGHFNQPLANVALPSGLQVLNLTSIMYNRPMEHVKLPDSLRQLQFGIRFQRSLEKVILPRSLQIIMHPNYIHKERLAKVKANISFDETYCWGGQIRARDFEALMLRSVNS